jgi:predicted metalloprotease
MNENCNHNHNLKYRYLYLYSESLDREMVFNTKIIVNVANAASNAATKHAASQNGTATTTAATAATTTTATATIGTSVVTIEMIKTLYRDFFQILKAQQQRQQQHQRQQKNLSVKQLQLNIAKNDPRQQVRDEFRRPLTSSSEEHRVRSTVKATTTSTVIESRYQYGINRFSFLRMNTTHYKPRRTNHHTTNKNHRNDTATDTDTATSTTTTTTTSPTHERFIYKNGQRFDLNSLHDATARTDKGYTISPYTGSNLDPQSVTRHRQGLKRAGFINNAHAKGMF